MDSPEVVTGTATEPLITRGTVVTIVTALLGLLAAWGLPIDGDKKAAIIATVVALAPLVLAWWARRNVNSPATMKKILAQRQ